MSRSFKKEVFETKKQRQEKELVESKILQYDTGRCSKVYATYYHLSVARFEKNQVLEPIEPQWVSSSDSKFAVESFGKGMFVTSKTGLLEWFNLIQQHYDGKELFLYEVAPIDKWSAFDCSISSVYVDYLEQYYIHGSVRIVSVALASKEIILNLLEQAE